MPIGTDIFGTTEQGFVTQRVTTWLNLLAVLMLILSAGIVFASRLRWLISTWIVIAIALAALGGLHLALDRMLDPTLHTVSEPDRFYAIHRLYLWITGVQWPAGIGLFCGLLNKP